MAIDWHKDIKHIAVGPMTIGWITLSVFLLTVFFIATNNTSQDAASANAVLPSTMVAVTPAPTPSPTPTPTPVPKRLPTPVVRYYTPTNSGYDAGYSWGEENDICDTNYSNGNSDDFNEGVQAWAADNCSNSSFDDNSDQ